MNRAELEFDRPADRQASRPPEERGVRRDEVRLLVSHAEGHDHARFIDLPRLLAPGTLLVVNLSATLPASLPAVGSVGPFLLNLSTRYGDGLWVAEPRRAAAEPGELPLRPGDEIRVARLTAHYVAPYPGLPRLGFFHIDGDVDRAMATQGEPIRYGYLDPPFPRLSAYQTIFSAVPGSAEMPSAGRPFTRRVVASLHATGVRLAPIILHTGVSSLEVTAERVESQPLSPEPFVVPAETAAAVNAARRDGHPVVAVGTTVVRALESAWDGTAVRAARGFTRRLIHPGNPARTIDGLISGLHDPHASHLALLFAVAGNDTIRGAYSEAVRNDYLWHEFGDSHLILPDATRRRTRTPRFFAANPSPARRPHRSARRVVQFTPGESP